MACAVRDRHAEAVGEQRLVRERAHDAAPGGELLERVGHGRAREDEVAGLREHVDARRAHPRGEPAARLDDGGAALAHLLGLVTGELGHGGRPRRDRARRAQRVERLGERRLGEAVADARGAEREALRERARDDEVRVIGDQRREVLAAQLEIRLVEHDDAGAGRADALDERRVELLARRVVRAAEPDEAHVGGLAHELLAREREPVAGLERAHLGAGVAAGDGVELVGRLRDERDVAAPERELGAQRQHLVAARPDDDLARHRRRRSRRSRA